MFEILSTITGYSIIGVLATLIISLGIVIAGVIVYFTAAIICNLVVAYRTVKNSEKNNVEDSTNL